MREEVGRSHAYLQEKEEEENNPPAKTSALMGPTTVITRHRFQIRHLGG